MWEVKRCPALSSQLGDARTANVKTSIRVIRSNNTPLRYTTYIYNNSGSPAAKKNGKKNSGTSYFISTAENLDFVHQIQRR